MDSADVKRSVNFLRGKANEIAANSGKYASAPAAIDFSAYKKKLKFTAAAVDTLEVCTMRYFSRLVLERLLYLIFSPLLMSCSFNST